MKTALDELHSKLAKMIPIENYEEMRKLLDGKNKEIEEISNANVNIFTIIL